MSILSEASPPITSIHAEPFSVGEIDAHPDRDRIWATVQAVKAEMSDDDDWGLFEEEDY